jgi:hypothetical protein
VYHCHPGDFIFAVTPYSLDAGQQADWKQLRLLRRKRLSVKLVRARSAQKAFV